MRGLDWNSKSHGTSKATQVRTKATAVGKIQAKIDTVRIVVSPIVLIRVQILDVHVAPNDDKVVRKYYTNKGCQNYPVSGISNDF